MKKQNRQDNHTKGRTYKQKMTGVEFLLCWVDLDDGLIYLHNNDGSCCEDLSVFVPEHYELIK